ncbi:Sterol 26-hydroxylase, mitochondrial [Seminavis robusta]|uniref:Sterol 26-hydroxylase, mitochondrial n=1 Tax=Seminavis robusta TaxID=568900 RepID=A0A9N8HWS4_9STRA|nr:Sterol 26-hydroxylase, mitochondrial [Seminavis robusta]|eukprot:Sro2292_g322220.1 Sterol 26-hydroxylase, mitochondrial (531) ;mRNA; r:2211-3803
MTSSSNLQQLVDEVDAWVLIYTLAALLVVYHVATAVIIKKKPWKIVPGWLPVLGHFHLVCNTHLSTQVLEEWAEKHSGDAGCYELDVAGNRFVVVCSSERAMEILKQRPYKVQRNPASNEASNSIGAAGVFSAEGSTWKEEKKLIAAAFNRNSVNDFLTSMKGNAKRLVQKWKLDFNDGKVQPISLDIIHMTANSITMVLMDRDFHFLEDPDSEMAHSVFAALRGFIVRTISPVWYWRIPVIGQRLDGFWKNSRYLDHVANCAIDDFERSKKAEQDNVTGNGQTMFLGKLYRAMEQEKSNLSRQRVVGNMFTAIAAGVDTTSKTLISALYLLAQDKSLQQELREHVKDFDMDAKSSTLQDLHSQLPMLKSFMHEIHRHYGVPFLMFKVAEAIPFCGATLEPGQDLMILLRYLSVRPDATDVPLGPDNASPSEFSSRRYLVPSEEAPNNGSNQKWTCPGPSDKLTGFLPFGHGVRKCPGKLYSEALSLYTLIRILQNFEFELAPNHPPVKIIFDLVMTPDIPIQLKLTKLQ